MCILLKLDLSDKKKTALSVIIFLLGFAAVMALCTAIGIDAVLSFIPLIILLPLYIAFWFISTYKGLKLLFVLLTSSILIFLPGLLGAAVSLIIDNEIVMTVTALTAIIAIIVLLIKFFRPRFIFILQTVDKNSYWLAISVIPLLYNAAVYMLGLYNSAGNTTPLFFQLILMAMAISAYILILLTFTQIQKRTKLEYTNELTNMQISAALENIEHMQEAQNQTAIYKHDLKHHIQIIHSYVTGKNYAELEHYLQEISNELNTVVIVNYCQNQTVNLVISAYAQKAEEAGIGFTVTADIPRHINIKENDICVVLSNALENALNAASNATAEKEIIFRCKTKNNRLTFMIENPYDGDIEFDNGLPISNRAHHGFGTQSITAITKKYNGLYSFEAKDGMFYFKLVI
ncbi:MAG: GHKL domain-containing protein [Christensenella sp.]